MSKFIGFFTVVSIITNFVSYAQTYAQQYENIARQWGMRAHFQKCMLDSKRNNYEGEEWIQDEKYKNSIYNVIPKCIADCATKQNEFSNIDSLKLKKGDIIEFAIKPYDVKYTISNWCSVVLYNTIAEIFYGDTEFYQGTEDTLFEVVSDRIKKHYHFLKCNTEIDSAVYSIKEYENILCFVDSCDRKVVGKKFMLPRGLYRNSYENFEFAIDNIKIKMPSGYFLSEKTDLIGRYSKGELKFYILGDCEVTIDECLNVTKILKKGDLSSGNSVKYLMWKKCGFQCHYMDAMTLVQKPDKVKKLDSKNKSKLINNITECKKSIISWDFLNKMKQDFCGNYKTQHRDIQYLSNDEQKCCNYRTNCIGGFLGYLYPDCKVPRNPLSEKEINALFDVCKFNLDPSQYNEYIAQAEREISDFEKDRYKRLKVIIQHYSPSLYAEVSHLL